MPLGSLSCCQRFALCAGLCPISHIFNEGSEHHWPRVVKVDFFFFQAESELGVCCLSQNSASFPTGEHFSIFYLIRPMEIGNDRRVSSDTAPIS